MLHYYMHVVPWVGYYTVTIHYNHYHADVPVVQVEAQHAPYKILPGTIFNITATTNYQVYCY